MGFLSNVSEIYLHQGYDNFTGQNDIALLKLEMPLNLSDSVSVIHLADENDPRNPGQIYTVAGWGATDWDGWEFTYEPILKTVEVADLGLEECLSYVSDTG